MAPPKFADVGKKVRDLFKKNHDYQSSLKVTNKGSPLSLETNLSLPVGGGKTKLTYKQSDYEVEANVDTSGKHGLTVTAKNLMPGLEVKADPLAQTLSSTHKGDALTLTGDLNLGKQGLDLSAVFQATDNLNIGAATSLSTEALKEYGLALEYTQGDILLNASTTKFEKFNLGWYQKCCGNVFGVDMSIGDKQSLRVGGETTCDNLTLRGKIDDKGIIGTSITTIIESNIKVTMAAQFDMFADDIAPSEIGFAFQLGDY